MNEIIIFLGKLLQYS